VASVKVLQVKLSSLVKDVKSAIVIQSNAKYFGRRCHFFDKL
jgi:hypothetical protein